MGVCLPDLPPSNREHGFSFAVDYLRQHGEATVAEIIGTEDKRLCDNLSNLLNKRNDVFIRSRHSCRNAPAIWRLRTATEAPVAAREIDMRRQMIADYLAEHGPTVASELAAVGQCSIQAIRGCLSQNKDLFDGSGKRPRPDGKYYETLWQLVDRNLP